MAIPTFTVVPSTANPASFSTDMDTWLSEIVAWTDAVNAAGNAYALSVTGTSTSSVTFGTGAKTLTTDQVLGLVAGMDIMIASTATPTNRMGGTVTAYNTSTKVLDVLIYAYTGTGSLSDWTLSMTAANGFGYLNIPQNSQSAAYTCVLSDQGTHIFHPSADTTARVFTIPANSSVAYPIGTAITFINQASAGELTLSITTDTMRLAGTGTTGSRTLAANGIATAIKLTATEWIINGSGLT